MGFFKCLSVFWSNQTPPLNLWGDFGTLVPAFSLPSRLQPVGKETVEGPLAEVTNDKDSVGSLEMG